MPRSSYVYCFQDGDTGTILAAFTVKHEAHFWYNQEKSNFKVEPKLIRLRDGHQLFVKRQRTAIPKQIEIKVGR